MGEYLKRALLDLAIILGGVVFLVAAIKDQKWIYQMTRWKYGMPARIKSAVFGALLIAIGIIVAVVIIADFIRYLS